MHRIHETIFPRGKRVLQAVRGICQFDVLNPCWDNRPSDKPGEHWASEPGFHVAACPSCTAASSAIAV